MKPQESLFNNLLLLLQNEDDREYAVRQAAVFAGAIQSRLSIVESIPLMSTRDEFLRREDTQTWLKERAKEIETLAREHLPDEIILETRALAGEPFELLISEAEKSEYDLVMAVPDTDSSVVEIVFGSLTRNLLHQKTHPLWFLRGKQLQLPSSILVVIESTGAMDQDEAICREVLPTAAALCRLFGSKLHILCLFGPQRWSEALSFDAPAMSEVRSSLMQAVENAPLQDTDPEIHIVDGSGIDVIPDWAETTAAELIIQARSGYNILSDMMRHSQVELLLQNTSTSYLFIPVNRVSGDEQAAAQSESARAEAHDTPSVGFTRNALKDWRNFSPAFRATTIRGMS